LFVSAWNDIRALEGLLPTRLFVENASRESEISPVGSVVLSTLAVVLRELLSRLQVFWYCDSSWMVSVAFLLTIVE